MPDVNIGRTTVGIMAIPGQGTPPGPSQPPIQTNNTTTLAGTRTLASFPVRAPSYTAGFDFMQAGVMASPRRAVVMSYAGDGGRRRGFELFQAPVNQYQAPGAPSGSYFVVGNDLSPTTVGNAPAALSVVPAAPGRQGATIGLVWEQGDLLCHLVAQGLSQTELSRIAASI